MNLRDFLSFCLLGLIATIILVASGFISTGIYHFVLSVYEQDGVSNQTVTSTLSLLNSVLPVFGKVAGVLLLLSAIWFIVEGFKTSLIWGFTSLVFPGIVQILFAVNYWSRARGPYYLLLVGNCLLGLSVGASFNNSNPEMVIPTAKTEISAPIARSEISAPTAKTESVTKKVSHHHHAHSRKAETTSGAP
jgi:hypothetical protein